MESGAPESGRAARTPRSTAFLRKSRLPSLWMPTGQCSKPPGLLVSMTRDGSIVMRSMNFERSFMPTTPSIMVSARADSAAENSRACLPAQRVQECMRRAACLGVALLGRGRLLAAVAPANLVL